MNISYIEISFFSSNITKSIKKNSSTIKLIMGKILKKKNVERYNISPLSIKHSYDSEYRCVNIPNGNSTESHGYDENFKHKHNKCNIVSKTKPSTL